MAKRLSEQYIKEDYENKVLNIGSVNGAITKDFFLVWDGPDIAKSHARNMEGIKLVVNKIVSIILGFPRKLS